MIPPDDDTTAVRSPTDPASGDSIVDTLSERSSLLKYLPFQDAIFVLQRDEPTAVTHKLLYGKMNDGANVSAYIYFVPAPGMNTSPTLRILSHDEGTGSQELIASQDLASCATPSAAFRGLNSKDKICSAAKFYFMRSGYDLRYPVHISQTFKLGLMAACNSFKKIHDDAVAESSGYNTAGIPKTRQPEFSYSSPEISGAATRRITRASLGKENEAAPNALIKYKERPKGKIATYRQADDPPPPLDRADRQLADDSISSLSSPMSELAFPDTTTQGGDLMGNHSLFSQSRSQSQPARVHPTTAQDDVCISYLPRQRRLTLERQERDAEMEVCTEIVSRYLKLDAKRVRRSTVIKNCQSQIAEFEKQIKILQERAALESVAEEKERGELKRLYDDMSKEDFRELGRREATKRRKGSGA